MMPITPNPNDLNFLRYIGKCASVSADNYICTLSANHYPREHMAQVMGGAEDGKVLSQWPW